MSASLLRDRHAHEQSKVTSVELFFDLVFVFAVTQLSHHLLEHLNVHGAMQTAILLLAVWTVWVYSTWASNWLDTEQPPVRLMLLSTMAAGLVVSTAIPKAFAEHGLAFAVAYAVMQLGRNLFTIWSIGHRDEVSRRNFIRIHVWLSLAAVCWIAGAMLPEAGRMLLWVLALTLELGSPWWRYWTPRLGRSSISDWHVSAHHFAERCGLFVIIALGESILVTGATLAHLPFSASTVAAFFVAFTGSVAMWWVYFATTADEASAALAASATPGRLARAAYTYFHLPIIAGIIVSAVGDELVLQHPAGTLSPPELATLIGGPALFLAGSALVNRMICGDWPRSHAVGLGVLAACLPFAGYGTPLIVSAVATAVMIGVGAWESVDARRRQAPMRPHR